MVVLEGLQDTEELVFIHVLADYVWQLREYGVLEAVELIGMALESR